MPFHTKSEQKKNARAADSLSAAQLIVREKERRKAAAKLNKGPFASRKKPDKSKPPPKKRGNPRRISNNLSLASTKRLIQQQKVKIRQDKIKKMRSKRGRS